MNIFSIDLKDPTVSTIVRKCYPNYNGRKPVTIEESNSFIPRNYWDGGTKYDYVAYHLISGETIPINNLCSNPFKQEAHTEVSIPENVCVVSHGWFCGKETGIIIMINSANMNKLLPQTKEIELTDDEKYVLSLAGLKSNYKKEQLQRYGINDQKYQEIKESLYNKRLMKQNGAVTIEGQNLRRTLHLY